MILAAEVFRYCERGADPGFWAEPLNALTNAAFLVAAIAAGRQLARVRGLRAAPVEWLLVGVLAAIGAGSFLFHTFATRWSAIADAAPIGIFMFVYLAYALRRLVGLPWLGVAAGLGAFAYAMHLADGIACRITLVSAMEAARGPCLNGSAAYLPALSAMVLIGAALKAMRHAASGHVLAAAMVFLVSMVFRTLDWELCDIARLGGRALGTHFMWHLLNAVTLYLLAEAAIVHGGVRASPLRS
ncbi:MAG: ceramidase domain-containing protein [Hyphomicrobiaceae bacterium]